MSYTLRPYQGDCIEAAAAAILAEIRRLLLVAPCGAGKTVIACEIIRRMRIKGCSALFVAGARELIVQTSEKLDAFGIDHGIIMAGFAPRGSDVQVASVQTLVRRQMPPADILIFDEADLARASSYEKVLAQYPNAVLIGMTATPWRADGKGLGEPVQIGDIVVPMFQKSIVVATPGALTDLGHLAPLDLERSFIFDPIDTSDIKTIGGDYDERQLGEAVTKSAPGRKIMGDAVQNYLDHGEGRRAVCFGVNVEHSEGMAKLFTAAGVRAEHVDGTTPRALRDEIFARVRNGETRVLCNVGIVTRGVDIPPLEIAILLRRTKSLSLYLQCIGRAARPSPTTGKASYRIYDHAGCIMHEKHGLPDDERDYSLTSNLMLVRKGDKDAAPKIRQCRQCYGIVRAQFTACPRCGASLVVARGGAITTEAATAIALSDVVGERKRKEGPGTRKVQITMLASLVDQAARGDWKPAAVGVRFRERWGFWPGRDLIDEATRGAGTIEAAIAAIAGRATVAA